MLNPRHPDHPGLPPTWTANYDTYEQALDAAMREKTRQSHRRLGLTVVILVIAVTASCLIGFGLPHLI